MRARTITFAVVLGASALPATGRAQHGGSGPPPVAATRAPREAAQFDFLVGQWELTVAPRMSGLAARIHGVPRLHGSWKAWRALDGWGVEDELRVVDESGNPRAYTHFVRMYDAGARRWVVSATDVYRQQLARSTAQWQGGEMVSSGGGVDADGHAYLTRTVISAITPSSFHYRQDRSVDGGATWEEGRVVIEAKRVAATAAR